MQVGPQSVCSEQWFAAARTAGRRRKRLVSTLPSSSRRVAPSEGTHHNVVCSLSGSEMHQQIVVMQQVQRTCMVHNSQPNQTSGTSPASLKSEGKQLDRRDAYSEVFVDTAAQLRRNSYTWSLIEIPSTMMTLHSHYRHAGPHNYILDHCFTTLFS